MDTIKNYVIRLAQWILREELARARENYKLQLNRANNLTMKLSHVTCLREDDMKRLAELRDWHEKVIPNDTTGRFIIDYARWYSDIRNINTNSVHPAKRWGIRSFEI